MRVSKPTRWYIIFHYTYVEYYTRTTKVYISYKELHSFDSRVSSILPYAHSSDWKHCRHFFWSAFDFAWQLWGASIHTCSAGDPWSTHSTFLCAYGWVWHAGRRRRQVTWVDLCFCPPGIAHCVFHSVKCDTKTCFKCTLSIIRGDGWRERRNIIFSVSADNCVALYI